MAVLIGGFFAFNNYIYDQKQGGMEDYKQATFEIEGRPILLGTEGTAYFGNVAKGDVNDDGVTDLAFLITQNSGGSGTFFYAVAALQNAAGKYNGSNAILLGDRIAPQTTEIRNGILIVNYADRKPDEPFTTQPSVGVSQYAFYDGSRLVPIPAIGALTIKGEMVCLTPWDREVNGSAECTYGLHDDLDRYFALTVVEAADVNFTEIPIGSRVEVSGKYQLQVGSNYAQIGTIAVEKISNSAGE